MEKARCKFCDKKIEGHTEHQVQYMMKQHLLSKHSDKINFDYNKK